MAEERAQRRLAASMAADVVGYSRLMQADEATLCRVDLRKPLRFFHVLMHIPAPLRPAFKRRAVRWLGRDAQSDHINTRGVRYGNGPDQLNRVKGVLRYSSKTSTPLQASC
jgi:hypothetical protein